MLISQTKNACYIYGIQDTKRYYLETDVNHRI